MNLVFPWKFLDLWVSKKGLLLVVCALVVNLIIFCRQCMISR